MARITAIFGVAIIFGLNVSADVAAQECASFSSSGGGGSHQGSCSGDEYGVVTYEASGTASLTIQCEYSNWRSSSGPSEQMTLGTAHTCGPAGPGEPPACQDSIFGPTNVGWNGSEVKAEMWGAHTGWDGQNCTFEGTQRTSVFLSHTGCDNGFCCSLEDDCIAIGEWMPGCKCQLSPILINLDTQGLQLTDRANGVNFDLNRDGRRERLAWTRGDREDAFLVWDRNENGQIDDGGELFGSVTDQPAIDRPNGFNALRLLDDNVDGLIDGRDSRFSELRLWVDRDHDGSSVADELHQLREKGIHGLSLDYRESRREDRFGNVFRYWGRVVRDKPSSAPTWAVDVFLVGGAVDSRGKGGTTAPCVVSKTADN